MESTVSVSKGVFVFKNGLQPNKQKGRGRKKKIPTGTGNIYRDEMWFQTYTELWEVLESKIKELNSDMFSSILSNLLNFIDGSYCKPVTEIPAGALLTGINMPDHAVQFETLKSSINEKISPHVAHLSSQDCPSLKNLVENMINQFINEDIDYDLDEENVKSTKVKIKKSQCSFTLLQSWYEDLYNNKVDNVLVVILPDFESFKENVLQDFIQIASYYVNKLPFVLVFGIATSLSALHKALPYHVSSKINIQVFNSQPSITYLNKIIENVLFSNDCPFYLGGKLFALFTDIFLFYDFSVTGFIQNFKFAMLEHFSTGNAKALCITHGFSEVLKNFSKEDFENVRMLHSFRRFVEAESPKNQIELLTDDKYFQKAIKKELNKLIYYMNNLVVLLECLNILTADLPKAPLGKTFREIYCVAVSKKLSETVEFKEAFQLLSFQSKDELLTKIDSVLNLLKNNIEIYTEENIVDDLKTFIEELNNLSNDQVEEVQEDLDCLNIEGTMQRAQLKQKLFQQAKSQNKPMNAYEKFRSKVVEYFEHIFEEYLKVPTDFTFHEIFFYNDISIQNHIIGSHRAAIHTALNDPQSYLDCSCCGISNDAVILSSMPDICIAYKLHLEYGKMINLYDWLQAFLSILDPVHADDDNEKREVDPQLQARFTQSVAEMEFLGFVKSSKRKTDHVSRLTWGG
ncbi:PREDICTED: origin recognition complex subunit 3 [Nicrophorus vespilloides]|uniref:Origin recognition complex subunit 3 n=1 Tax=Nicrophorus vespilloides TaxID=110193 RepID=A0ABM1N8I4_NICVS|nr:PREDICTED: origin recognition complex subunit 3 [Nicrophorus vespilloides]